MLNELWNEYSDDLIVSLIAAFVIVLAIIVLFEIPRLREAARLRAEIDDLKARLDGLELAVGQTLLMRQ